MPHGGIRSGRNLLCFIYSAGVGGSEIVQYILLNQGHAWPGGRKGSRWADEPSQLVSANDLMFEFLRNTPRRPNKALQWMRTSRATELQRSMGGRMKQFIGLLICLGLVVGCAVPTGKTIGGKKMKVLPIRWQRLVDEQGQTCDRCGTTETAVEDAIQKLKRSLKELDIDVVLEKKALSPSTFSKDPLQSNRIWIAGEPLEAWLSATSGQSQCCSTCGDSECRTVTVDGKTYEAIPAELIVKAGLLAGAQLLHGEPRSACCPTADSPQESPGCCPPLSQSQK